MNATLNPAQMTDAQKTAHIKKVVTEAGNRLKAQYPILQRQDAIGVAVMLFSLAGMIGSGVAYYHGLIAWWACIPLVALFASFIHELEHDLIHLMYFRKKPWANNLMLLIGWIARPSTISPFVRRRLHLHHHKHSGTESDLEERGITNGERWGLRRLLMTGDNMLAIYLRPLKTKKMVRAFIQAQKPRDAAELKALIKEQVRGYWPLGNLHYLLWHGFIVFHAVDLTAAAFGAPIAWSAGVQSVMGVVDFLAVVWLAPSALRTFCLHFVSSNMHYYGDVEDENIMQQCQVLNPWWMLPFQLFCFNFGSTHAIHHFVVGQPFYLRQLVARDAHQVMREMGVRFNDFGSFRRANRFHRTSARVAEPAST
ncbi:MAG TPA: fatty acid desaturase [Nevskiales bacterium]|nr:fatty acid desaturase [Nevskiales bacterium]